MTPPCMQTRRTTDHRACTSTRRHETRTTTATRPSRRRCARRCREVPGGFTSDDVAIGTAAGQVTCPAGNAGISPGKRSIAGGVDPVDHASVEVRCNLGLSASLSQTTPPMMTASQKARIGVRTSSKKTGPKSAAPTAPMPAHTA